MPPVDCNTIIQVVTVFFDFNDTTLTEMGKASLDSVRRCLTAEHYEVGGHTDSDGPEEYNQRLSLCRAEAVVRYLAAHGVPKQKMVVMGYGESQPVVANDTPENKAKNRRITFRVR